MQIQGARAWRRHERLDRNQPRLPHALSNDELDAVSGGKDIVVSVQASSIKLFGLTFHFASCDNGQKIGYVTR